MIILDKTYIHKLKSSKLIDQKVHKVLLAIKRNISHFHKSNLINFQTHK